MADFVKGKNFVPERSGSADQVNIDTLSDTNQIDGLTSPAADYRKLNKAAQTKGK